MSNKVVSPLILRNQSHLAGPQHASGRKVRDRRGLKRSYSAEPRTVQLHRSFLTQMYTGTTFSGPKSPRVPPNRLGTALLRNRSELLATEALKTKFKK